MEGQQIFLNLIPIHPKANTLKEYGLVRIEPKTLNRQVIFRLAADVAKSLAGESKLVFSVGDTIYSVNALENLGPFSPTLDIGGTVVTFKVHLGEILEDQRGLPPPPETERLVNRLVDWYLKETLPASFRIENATYKAENLFRKLQANLYRTYKININEGTLRATRHFGGDLYLLLDTEYRVTWEQNLWEDVKAFVVNNLNSNVAFPNATTVRRINEHYGRVMNKSGVRVQGVNKVGEYEVLEFDFAKNPTTPGTVGELSQEEYFNKKYAGEVGIKDKSQPLVKVRSLRGYFSRLKETTYHVPELLEFDRIPPYIRSNTKVMASISNITKPLPRSRFAHLLNVVQGDPFGKTKGFASDGFVSRFITSDSKPVEASAFKLDPPVVKMGDVSFAVAGESDFLGKIAKRQFHRVVNPKKVGLLFLEKRRRDVEGFYSKLTDVSSLHGLVLPSEVQMVGVETGDYRSFVEKVPQFQDYDLVISFGSMTEDNLYSALKQEMLVKFGILSQHITYEKTVNPIAEMFLQQRDSPANTILTLIALQLCAKLGGAPWAFAEPIYEENCPVVGLDVFHQEDGSVTGACAAFDAYGEYLFSNTTLPNTTAQEAINSLEELLGGVLERYAELRGKPSKVFVVRDGLSFTQEQTFLQGAGGEISIINDVLGDHGVSDHVFLMERTGTNLRMFKKISDVKAENPDAGTVLMGKPFASNEMLMVSQESYVGTVDPVLYKVMSPSSPEMLRIASAIYKLSRHHWVTARSIKIPAPAYHADEITYLIRNVLGASPKSRSILDRPFYL